MTDLASFLKTGDRIFVGGSSNEPRGLLAALAEQALPPNLTFIQFPLPGLNATDFTAWNESARIETFFMSPALQRAADPTRVEFLPMQMRWVFDYLLENVDVCLLQGAYDRAGVLRLGPNVDFAEAVLISAKTIIVEVNRSFIAPAGGLALDPKSIDVLIETDMSLPEMPMTSVDETANVIGRLVAGLIKDGDCLQTGIGAIPAAILAQLKDKNDLGLHGGLIDEGGRHLIEAGNVTGRRKTEDLGLHVTGMALGDAGFYQWLAEAPEVVFRPANYTHEVSVIRRLNQFVSINSAVEVDVLGQVNAEFAGGRQISGTGGSVDFMRGARSAKAGRSIIAMTATARGGSVSRIVPKVDLVTALRTDVDLVVTEFGIARLEGLSVRERVRALIAIAAPQFRDELASSLKE